MSDRCYTKSDPDQPALYQIRIKVHLDQQWAYWFGGLTVSLEENCDMLLTGQVIDQAALYGLLRQVRDLGMPLLSVNRIESDLTNSTTEQPRKVQRGKSSSS